MSPQTEPVVLVVPASGFPGAPFLALVSRFQDAGVPFVAASENPEICHSNDGVRVTASRPFDDKRLLELPAIVVFGDERGSLERSSSLRTLIKRAVEKKLVVGAVGRGLLALAAAGVLRGHGVAASPELEEKLGSAGAFSIESPCVVAGTLVTATDAGAAALADELFSMTGIRSLPIELR